MNSIKIIQQSFHGQFSQTDVPTIVQQLAERTAEFEDNILESFYNRRPYFPEFPALRRCQPSKLFEQHLCRSKEARKKLFCLSRICD